MTQQSDRLSAALAGRYRIERELGAGGMATVYLAEDLKHDRKVAIKVLKPELAAVLGAERFVVEIKTTAAMSHPHILPLFDSGTADGFLFYVMPFIHGETVREKLNRESQFGVDEAVRIAREVADALDYAHRHGVIHRDIKPENILLHDGRAMVMDFGIALAVSAAAGGRMTETGLSLGTPHYMSPEQATAEKEITPRSDVYSLASVLYEMLAGEPPHTGGTAQAVIMKIITDTARPVDEIRKNAPANVVAALEKALEKLPADRFANAKEFADALGGEEFSAKTKRGAKGRAAAPADWRQRAAIPALAACALLAALAGWGFLRAPEPPPLSRYEVALPLGKGIASTNWSPLAVSPDGSKLVYMGESGRLFLRSRDLLDPVEIAGTESAFNPFFSHDGLRVGFMSGTAGGAEVKVAVLGGGPPTVIASGAGGPGAAFGYDGYVYLDASGIGPLRRAPETGGETEDVSVRDSTAGELQHNWPEPLPNGRGVLFVIDRAGPGVNVTGTNDIAVLDLKTRKHTVLMRGVFAKYTRTGHILYVTSTGVLMGVAFDQDRMELKGTPVALVEGVTVRRGGGGVDLAVSANGTVWLGLGGGGGVRKELGWLSQAGDFTAVPGDVGGDFGTLALSPEGARVAISIVDATGEQIWVKNIASEGGALSKLTFEGVNQFPRWHPDGKRLLFSATFRASMNVQTVPADGTDPEPKVLVRDPSRIYLAAWSPDGRWITYEHFAQGTARDVSAVRTGGDSSVVRLVTTRFQERLPSVSPDGRWLLYASNTTGSSEVYVRPFPNAAAGLYQVSSGGGTSPRWSRDGREIFYVNANNALARVAVGTGSTFTFSGQRVLFPLRGIADWDVAPDGRFIAIRQRGGTQGARLVVFENFFEELKAKVPR